MLTIATIGPKQSHAWQAASQYAPDADIKTYPHTASLMEAFAKGDVDLAVVPVYNTREGENKAYFRLLDQLRGKHWIDNIVLPVNLSLGVLGEQVSKDRIQMLVGKQDVFSQCEEFIGNTMPDVSLLGVHDVDQAIEELKTQKADERGVVDSEELLRSRGLHLLERDVAPHNRTRYAVLGPEQAVPTGYDATAVVTKPLDDRVGLLVDILSEFSKRGINIIDMRSENDVKTQKLRIFIEMEGHILDEPIIGAIHHVEEQVLGVSGCIKVLGSFPRVDMRTKYIKSIGFIGSGAMSQWFVDRLQNEGYRVLVTGRTTSLRPEEMIPQVDVLAVCVPISVTAETITQYGPLLEDGKALILLAGESETTVDTALAICRPGVEIMLVHNLWGPQAATMKDKNAIVVRTPRSGMLCAEFESFLYKHGADIYHDSPTRHDLLMGIGQKLPTVISVALAMTLDDHKITSEDIASHCTLTSLYPILAMARVHSQNPRTYAEIMATGGDGRKIVHDFVKNLTQVIGVADSADIEQLCRRIEANVTHFSKEFLQARMGQSKAVDEVLGKMI
jgi:prephenate dehydratase/prephenate dehydrogenase